MKTIFIQLSEEEFQEHITIAVQKALENIVPLKQETEYLTRKEAASQLRITLPTLNKYTKGGNLKGYKINGRVLYRKEDIQSALTSVEPLKYSR